MQIRNWKTTLAGVGAIIGIVAKLMQGGSIGTEEITILITAVGLIAAKDSNVSGPPKV
jgi:hypothetical protein